MFFEENFNIKYFIINFAISLNILGVFCAIFDFFSRLSSIFISKRKEIHEIYYIIQNWKNNKHDKHRLPKCPLNLQYANNHF